MQLDIARDLILDTTVTEYTPRRPKGARLFGTAQPPWDGAVYRADDHGALDHPYTYWTTREEALTARYGEGATVVEMARVPLSEAVRAAFEAQRGGPRPTAHVEVVGVEAHGLDVSRTMDLCAGQARGGPSCEAPTDGTPLFYEEFFAVRCASETV